MQDNEGCARFLRQFVFKPELAGCIGIERERLLATPDGVFVPRAKEFLDSIRDPQWTYELSACQVEDKTTPSNTPQRIWDELKKNDETGFKAGKKLGVNLVTRPVASPDIPLDIYPDPRYQEIAKCISVDKLRAACRVTGLHVHIGMSDWDEALRVYNCLREEIDFLCRAGDCSGGERLRLYKIMAENWRPPEIKSPEHFFQIAEAQGFDQNPRNCYWLIRISPHGTVELRMFDMIENLYEILGLLVVVRSITEIRRQGWKKE